MIAANKRSRPEPTDDDEMTGSLGPALGFVNSLVLCLQLFLSFRPLQWFLFMVQLMGIANAIVIEEPPMDLQCILTFDTSAFSIATVDMFSIFIDTSSSGTIASHVMHPSFECYHQSCHRTQPASAGFMSLQVKVATSPPFACQFCIMPCSSIFRTFPYFDPIPVNNHGSRCSPFLLVERYGEARHPGPDGDSMHFRVAITNPTSIISKLDVFHEIASHHCRVDLFACAETSATQVAQQTFTRGIRKLMPYQCWSPRCKTM